MASPILSFMPCIIDWGLHFLCEFLQRQAGCQSRELRRRLCLLLDGAQTCSLIVREIEFLLPCQEGLPGLSGLYCVAHVCLHCSTMAVLLFGARSPFPCFLRRSAEREAKARL